MARNTIKTTPEGTVSFDDLYELRSDLLREIEGLKNNDRFNRKWLRSFEVMQLLNISAGTLQNMRFKGVLSYSKVNTMIFYDYEEILKLFEKNRINIKEKMEEITRRRR
ncbi:helix-turn-helix domain-containing protein [Carboxylicivirga marina]|uniref:Helix-turn-helix domain-containing protein n=1 Tax=Carboxylicivirga marina TaxID=2800988 RepID=A0ABS1HKP1_9BACT|nr:helix-turn-helix domain-containing protein [Carboxylicivirga marina]MBK3518249.1 helix-turn-helix domain-containing protein [Carboxylicivirga marina]